ncbi:hypothetical protein DFS34DRAFT_680664 [Phlyctochytrium arcticum]|nr:hypothetical protein DFS34DRAFT_680664 [Phlyctochytrium arcticum]
MSVDDPLMNDFNSNSTFPEDDAPLVQDARWYNVILWAPFVLIPFSIIFARISRYLWRFYQARMYGYDEDLFSDPLAELGLSITRGYRNTADIRKIRKEHRKVFVKQARAERAAAALETGPTPARRFIAGFAPLNAAESYFHHIRRKTRRTWSDRLSPDAVRRWIDTSRYARTWMVLQVLCTLVAIVNYVLLTYSIQRSDRRHIKYLDLFLATMFLFDYSLSLYTAEDRLRFYFNPGSLVDLLSIVPPFVYVLISETSQYVWFLGLLRILRASRILRTYRLLSFSETEEKRELTILALTFTNFVFLSASIINALESINATKTDHPSLSNWHDSLYYIMVTFSTIGFGDLTPSSIPSRIVVMLLIIMVIIFVPIQTGKIAEIYNSTSVYQRAKYAPKMDHAHVILSGTVSYTAVVDFCREYFVADPVGHVVILVEDEPSLDVRKLLRHPFYRHRVIYLRGTALSIPDLRRAQAMFATALFLLNLDSPSDENGGGGGEDEQLRVTRGVDAQILMTSLVARNAFPGLAIFSEVQDIRSQDLSVTCGIDRVLCIDEVKMSLLARNCLVPGMLTMILNLVHTYKDAGHFQYTLANPWTAEYSHGAGHQIYSFKVPAGLVGVRFPSVVKEIYNTFGATVFALMSSNAGFNTNPLRLNPGKQYRLRDDDVAFVMGDGGDELMLRIMLHYKDTAIRDELNLEELGQEMRRVVVAGRGGVLKSAATQSADELLTPSQSTPAGAELPIPEVEHNEGDAAAEEEDDATSRQKSDLNRGGDTVLPAHIQSHIILCGSMTSRGIRHFVKSIRTSGIRTLVPKRAAAESGTFGASGGVESSLDTSSILGSSSLPSGSTLPQLSSNSPQTIAAHHHTPIVILLDSGLPTTLTPDSIWTDILAHPHVYILRGTALKRTSLLFAGVARCAKIVVFAKNQKTASGGIDLPDANSVFIVKMLQREWPATSFCVELANGSNVKFFSSKNSEWNADNLRTQSILNNYALSISDRIALYKKVRNEGAEQAGNFWYRLVQFTTGGDGEEGGLPPVATTIEQQTTKVGKVKERRQRRRSMSVGSGRNTASSKRGKRRRAKTAEEEVLFAADGAEMGMIELDETVAVAKTTAFPEGATLSTSFNEIPPSQATPIPPSNPTHGSYSSLSHDSLPSSSSSSSLGLSDTDSPALSGPSPTDPNPPPADPLSTAYLRRLIDSAELNETGLSPFPAYHFDRHFAAGMVTTSCFMHSLLAQSYFRPYVVDVVRALSTSILHIPVPATCINTRYSDLVAYCCHRGIVCLGLYRNALKVPPPTSSRISSQQPTLDSLPYVYTNCRSFDIVRKDDLVFAIRPQISSS